MQSRLSNNFRPNAIYRPEVCIRTTLAAARTHGFAIERIMFEPTEGEVVGDGQRLAEILREYKRMCLLTAVDDVGVGYAGLNLLADFQPVIVKIDMGLVRHVDRCRPRRAVARGMLRMGGELGIQVLAEGVETGGKRDFFDHEGVRLMQGYLFGRPAFQSAAQVDPLAWPACGTGQAARPWRLIDVTQGSRLIAYDDAGRRATVPCTTAIGGSHGSTVSSAGNVSCPRKRRAGVQGLRL